MMHGSIIQMHITKSVCSTTRYINRARYNTHRVDSPLPCHKTFALKGISNHYDLEMCLSCLACLARIEVVSLMACMLCTKVQNLQPAGRRIWGGNEYCMPVAQCDHMSTNFAGKQL